MRYCWTLEMNSILAMAILKRWLDTQRNTGRQLNWPFSHGVRVGLYQHHGAVKRTRATDERQDPGDFTFLNEMFLAAK